MGGAIKWKGGGIHGGGNMGKGSHNGYDLLYHIQLHLSRKKNTRQDKETQTNIVLWWHEDNKFFLMTTVRIVQKASLGPQGNGNMALAWQFKFSCSYV